MVKFILLALVIGGVVWMLVSAEMMYKRADKEKSNRTEDS